MCSRLASVIVLNGLHLCSSYSWSQERAIALKAKENEIYVGRKIFPTTTSYLPFLVHRIERNFTSGFHDDRWWKIPYKRYFTEEQHGNDVYCPCLLVWYLQLVVPLVPAVSWKLVSLATHCTKRLLLQYGPAYQLNAYTQTQFKLYIYCDDKVCRYLAVLWSLKQESESQSSLSNLLLVFCFLLYNSAQSVTVTCDVTRDHLGFFGIELSK